mmetsp:Transcript_20718/g.32620  ORF Transcript_20718/g.32620 Transcript_20718/m.32620 type:complete len:269 (+) Transcript_20718:223-1029(+)
MPPRGIATNARPAFSARRIDVPAARVGRAVFDSIWARMAKIKSFLNLGCAMGAGKITTGSECGVRRACAGVVAAGRMLLQEGQRKKISKGNWMCDRCERSNKVSKVRCGGCQRWRDGQRPAMRKSAKAAYRPYQLPNGVSNHAPQPPPTQMMHPQMPMLANRPHMPMPDKRPQMPMLDNQPPAPPAAMLGQTTNALNTAATLVLPVENSQLGIDKAIPTAQAPAAAKTTDIVAKPNIGAWTCTKCTCDNLATEIICQICECVRDGWMV